MIIEKDKDSLIMTRNLLTPLDYCQELMKSPNITTERIVDE